MIFIRISGDEFGVFWQGISQEHVDASIVDLWNRISSYVLNKPIEIDNKSIPLGASVGMAVYNLDTTNVYDLIDFADFAMYLAKNAGKNRYVRFDLDSYKLEKECKS
jgi:diguanylate cyclase (GGDEF)-like protein